MMETIVFIGSNKSGTSREALVTSGKLGFHTVLLTNRKDFFDKWAEFPELNEMFFLDDLKNKKIIFQIIEVLSREGKFVRAVVSFIDPYVSFAAGIAKELGLTPLSVSSLGKMEEKTCFREELKELPASPHFYRQTLEEPIAPLVERYTHHLPLIIKAPVSNGSKDVLLAETSGKLEESLQHFYSRFPGQDVLLEEYLTGPQYLIEVMVHRGAITIVAIIEQEILQGERFIVTGYRYPAKLTDRDQKALRTSISSIIHKLGLSEGCCHLEMRYINAVWKLIEINPRMSGGAMNRIIEEGTGINYVKEVLMLFLGREPFLEKTKQKHVYAKFITIGERGRLIKVTGKKRALAFPGVKEVYIKPRKGAILTKPFSLGDRYAYVVAAAESAEEAQKIATAAAGQIKFYLEPL